MKRPMILALTALALTAATTPLAKADTALRQSERDLHFDVFNTLISAYNGARENLSELRECDVDGIHNADAKAEYHGTPGDHTFPVDHRFEGMSEVDSYDALPDSIKTMDSQKFTPVIREYGELRDGSLRAFERCDAKRNGRKVKWPLSTFM